MIPIIFDNPILTGNGYGRMADAISCTVTHEINGQFELAMEYPVTGQHYDRIEAGMVLFAAPDPVTAEQPFRIYRVTRPLNGVVTVYARHIAYDMSGISVLPFTASSLSEAFSLLPSKCVPSCPFTFATTRSVASRISTSTPMPLWSLLGGVAGSFLDVYGGEWDFNGLTASLPSSLGQDNGVSVRYGKNMTELEQDITVESTWAAVLPFWYNEETGQLVKTEQPVPVQGAFGSRVLTLDLSEEWEEAPTVAQLTARTEQYITANKIGEPQVAWKVNMAMLDQSEEYKGLAILERVQLGDTVTVIYEPYGIDVKARAVMIEYDVLAERYRSINLGRVKQNLAKIVASTPAEITAAVNAAKSALEKAIDSSTDFITHGAGYMRFIYNDDKVLQEIVSLDNPDINQAQSVWRWNNGGFGHSSTGYAGPYTVAMTQDGAIVADFITAGTLSGDRVRTGIITDVSGRNYWNLNTGEWKNVAIETTLENLQEQIDNNIETFTGPAVPTLTNYPANAWTTTEEKDKHIGDLYVVNSQGGDYEGFYYRFEKTGSTYQWRLLKDTEVTKALAEAEEALRRVGIAETQIEQNAEAITLRATKTEAQGYANTAEGNAISAAATDATTKANAAESAAKSYADAQITISADAITSNVSATYETKADATTKLNTAKTYADGKASEAEDAANDYTDGKLTDYSTTVQMNSAIEQTASNITSTVSATYETKAAATQNLNTAKSYAETQAADAEAAAVSTAAADATTKANAAEAGAKGYTDNKLTGYSTTTQMNSAISQSAGSILQTVSETYTTKTEFGGLEDDVEAVETRVSSAESTLEVQAGQIASKVSETDYNGNTIASKINQNATTVKINAAKIDLQGAVTISDFDSAAQAALVKNTTTKNQYAQSASSTTAPTSGWQDTIPAYNATNKYIWLRVATTKTFADNTSSTTYSTPVVDVNLTKSIQDAATAQSTATGAATAASTAQSTADAALGTTKSTQQYYLSTSSTSATGGTWQDTVPTWSSGKYVWTRIKTDATTKSGTALSPVYSTAVYDANLTTALSTASSASSAASAAQSTADGAVTAAGTAQTTANNAASAASTAQTTANGAVKSSSVKTQYYLSTSASSATGGSWSDTIPTWADGKYLWTRIATTTTPVSGTASTTYQPSANGAYDSNLTNALSTATAAASTAAAAQTKANAALVTSVSVYFRASTSTVPGKPTAEVTSVAVDTDDAWTLCMPRPKKGTTYYTCEQNKDGNGTVSWTAVQQMANTTYVASWASSANATYIDGANIYTGTVTADKIAANEVFTQKLTAQDFNITGGSVNIETTTDNWDKIQLKSTTLSTELSPGGVRVKNESFQSKPVIWNVSYAVGPSGPRSARTEMNSLLLNGSWGVRARYTSEGLYFIDPSNKSGGGVYATWVDASNPTSIYGYLDLGNTSTNASAYLDSGGLVFKNSSNAVTAAYNSAVESAEYTPSNDTITFLSSSRVYVFKSGTHGNISVQVNIQNGEDFAAGTEYTIATLPTQYRPKYRLRQMVTNQHGTSACMVSIGTGGAVTLYRYANSAAWISSWIRAEIPVIFANP